MEFFQKRCDIVINRQLSDTVYDIWLRCPEIYRMAKPGQFVNIAVPGFFLRRPISICEAAEERLRLVFEVRGAGTKALSQITDNIDIIAPLGNRGFEVDKYKSAVLVGGGIGTPPLKFAQNKLEKSAAVLGFRSKENVIMADEFRNVTICTDDGSYLNYSGHHGNISEPLEKLLASGEYEAVFACGPKPMLKAVVNLAEKYNTPCEVSLEERMACGVGACLGCACKTVKDGSEIYSHVCKDGPVFDGKAVIL
ncbi:MAG: dihydroorotate dehydrogenase electron transfer subunit [Ruminococcus sp.]|jgi:dihydroorotate dehydrogenase electron transfer subunit|nr:dihydroorotate dehydrogenase electron transfer subunit [Ruminococcus sp.]